MVILLVQLVLSKNNTDGFIIRRLCRRHPSLYLIATEAGTINAYSPSVDKFQTIVVVDNSSKGSVYKGLAIFGNTLYAADFRNGKIDVFNSRFEQLTNYPFVDQDTFNPIPFSFITPPTPPSYAPFNIVKVDHLLYVLYAEQDSAKHDDVPGHGHGYISVFNPDGSFVRRFVSQDHLNSPWAFLPTGCGFGFPQGSFLVGNFGSGHIHVYDERGHNIGELAGPGGAITIYGLWGLAANLNFVKKVFFAAGPNNETNGLLGDLTDISGLECEHIDCVVPSVV